MCTTRDKLNGAVTEYYMFQSRSNFIFEDQARFGGGTG